MWTRSGDLAVADVREGPRAKCGLVEDSGLFLGPAIGQPVCRVCCLLETLLMRWDTCQDLDEDQNLTTMEIFKSLCVKMLPCRLMWLHR